MVNVHRMRQNVNKENASKANPDFSAEDFEKTAADGEVYMSGLSCNRTSRTSDGYCCD